MMDGRCRLSVCEVVEQVMQTCVSATIWSPGQIFAEGFLTAVDPFGFFALHRLIDRNTHTELSLYPVFAFGIPACSSGPEWL